MIFFLFPLRIPRKNFDHIMFWDSYESSWLSEVWRMHEIYVIYFMYVPNFWD